MGYIIVLILGVILVAVVIAAVAKQGRRSEKGHLDSDHPVSVTEPAAEAPTPAASSTSTQAQQDAAQERTTPS